LERSKQPNGEDKDRGVEYAKNAADVFKRTLSNNGPGLGRGGSKAVQEQECGTDQTTGADACRAGAVVCAPAGSQEVADILRTSAQGCAHFKRGRSPGCAGAACPPVCAAGAKRERACEASLRNQRASVQAVA